MDPREIERMRELHYEHSAADIDGEAQEEQDELQQKLAETYERLRQTNDTQAIRRVNQQAKEFLGKLGLNNARGWPL